MTEPTIFDQLTRRGRERIREVWTGVRVANCGEAEIAQAKTAGYEPGRGEDAGAFFVGRDPREMTQDELRAMGHEQMSLSQAIRAKCLDCMAGSADEVRKCVAMACPSWPYRMGTNPWRTPLSDEQREIRRQRALDRGLGRRASGQSLPDESGDAP